MNEIIEGSGFAKLSGVIKTLGYNKDVDIELATVIAPLPNLRIQIDNMKIELEADDVIIAEHLTDIEREISFSIPVSGSTTSAGSPSHSHGLGNIAASSVKVTVKSPLKAGDRVIVASIKAGQSYVVLDKAVILNGA
ncbi:DUF2577 domain-containing protein [Paenibacillus sp. PDC88]|uniref:DUF2577 domain-containing protein n=1 Tax=Paenibacillus sp. PDC88 TaxID=1884375 RepID=UPI00089D2406|nr:DUF2577 domain-containing protein [Paenibacillus sp. PDC88]SDW22052.1 Protein of unknown function [Paenibacillus sp. PDC88]